MKKLKKKKKDKNHVWHEFGAAVIFWSSAHADHVFYSVGIYESN